MPEGSRKRGQGGPALASRHRHHQADIGREVRITIVTVIIIFPSTDSDVI
jgi:hypothetical protein